SACIAAWDACRKVAVAPAQLGGLGRWIRTVRSVDDKSEPGKHPSTSRRRISRLGNVIARRGSMRRTAIGFVLVYALARLVAFGREGTIAYLFGATRNTDAYVAATALP